MNKAYLIYKPILGYEDGEEPFLVCNDEETAKKVVSDTLLFIKDLSQQIGREPYLPCEFNEELWGIHHTWLNRKLKIMEEIIWPYGFKVCEYDWSDPNCVSYKEIDVID